MATEKVHCNGCGGLRNHTIKAEYRTQDEEIEEGRYAIDWEDRYEVLECGGCGEVTFRHKHYFSEAAFAPDDTGWSETHYPPRLSRRLPTWIDDTDDDLQSVLRETYRSIHGDMLILANHGARTAIDIVMTRLVGDIGGFDKKLNKMESDKHIDNEERKLFEAVVESGSAAAHRGYRPEVKTLGHVMDILEALIFRKIVSPSQMSGLTAHAAKILAAVPKRAKTQNPGARPAAAPPDAVKDLGQA